MRAFLEGWSLHVNESLTILVRQQYDDGIRIATSARKHGITQEDISHALDHMVRYREQEYDGELRILVIGPAPSGRLLEIVLVPADDPALVIHADVLRPSRFTYL